MLFTRARLFKNTVKMRMRPLTWPGGEKRVQAWILISSASPPSPIIQKSAKSQSPLGASNLVLRWSLDVGAWRFPIPSALCEFCQKYFSQFLIFLQKSQNLYPTVG